MRRVDLEQRHTVLDVALVRAVPHSILKRGRERGTQKNPKKQNTTLRAATSRPQGASASPSGPVLPPPLFPGNLLAVAQVRLTPGTVPFRRDTRPSRAGSTAQSGPVGRGGWRRRRRWRSCAAEPDGGGPAAARSGRGSSLQPPRKQETTTLRANSAELGGGEGVCEKGRECIGRWGKGPRTCTCHAKVDDLFFLFFW